MNCNTQLQLLGLQANRNDEGSVYPVVFGNSRDCTSLRYEVRPGESPVRVENMSFMIIPPNFRLFISVVDSRGRGGVMTMCPHPNTRIIDNFSSMIFLPNTDVECTRIPDAFNIVDNRDGVLLVSGSGTAEVTAYFELPNTPLSSEGVPKEISQDTWKYMMCTGQLSLHLGAIEYVKWLPQSYDCDRFMETWCGTDNRISSDIACVCLHEEQNLDVNQPVTCLGRQCVSSGYQFPHMRRQSCQNVHCTQLIDVNDDTVNLAADINMHLRCGSEPQDNWNVADLHNTLNVEHKQDHQFSNILMFYICMACLCILICLFTLYLYMKYDRKL